MGVRFVLFGSPTLEHDDGSVALPFERRSQLLAFLALKRSWVGRAELAAMLWPEQETKLAYANLRKTLFRLQSLPWAPPIELQGGALRLESDTDVHAFDSALRERRIADALPLRRGELLAGFDDDGNEAWSNWLAFERDRLRAAWRDAALGHLALDIDPGEGIELSARLLEADPLDEAALRAHMAVLARSGQNARARQVYREFIRRIEDELGLAPGAELKALHDTLGTTVAAPPPASPTATRDSDESFIGRSGELRRVAGLLAQSECRLLCVIGPGGVGKTRLAQRTLRQLAPGYADGAAFVPLDDLTSAAELGGRLARELDVALTGRGEPLDQVIEFLRERQTLLVLDNFEQLAGEASVLERLLNACAGLKIIVTSRVRLASPMEWLFPLEGLPCPEAEDQDRIEAFDAARLFIQAARRVEPALLPAAEAESIVEICRQVEGLPLALELAAAWTRVLSCDAIAAELRRGTELLQAVDAAHPARHASIEVVFDQSWRLLSAVEREALARLSVFRGGFSAEAARAVAGAPLPVLGALVDKSLLRKEGHRLFMHPLVQQLATLRLGDGAARASAQHAHAAYFHRLLDQRRSAVEKGERDALLQLDVEFENCRQAWRWAAGRGAANDLSRSIDAISMFCDHRSRQEEGLALVNEALSSVMAQRDSPLKAVLLSRAAHFEYRLDRYKEALATATRGLEILRRAPDDDARARCLKVLGTSQLRLGQLKEAKRCLEESLRLAPARSDPRHSAAIISSLALIEKAQGNYDAAMRLSLEALAHHRRLGDVGSEALSLNNLAALHIERQEFEIAGEYLRPALVLCDRLGLVVTRVFVLSNLIGVSDHTGQPEAAESYARLALEQAQAIGNRFVVSYVKMQNAKFALRRHDLTAARAALREAMDIAIAIARPALLIEGMTRFGEILAAQGAPDCGRAVMTFALEHPDTAATERDELRRVLARMPAFSGSPLRWPGMTLDELAHRIVIEADVAHAPLIAALRGAD